MLALLTGLKPAVMMDYWFERCGAPGEALASVGQLILELRALYAGACPEIAELRCLQLGDCVFLLRPSLQSARRDAPPPVFLRLDGNDAPVRAPTAAAPRRARPDAAAQRLGPRIADEADAKAAHAAWGACARRVPSARVGAGLTRARAVPAPPVCFANDLLAMCDRGDYVIVGDATELAAASVLPSPTLHGLLLGYPCVLLFTLPNGCALLWES